MKASCGGIVAAAAVVLIATCDAAFTQGLASRRGGGATTTTTLMFFGSGGGASAQIPTSTGDRDQRAIGAIQKALQAPKTRGLALVECEFPPLGNSLNKMGDGSRQSAQAVDQANLAFCKKLVRALSLPLIGSNVCLLLSAAASAPFAQQAESQLKASRCVSLRNGAVSEKDVAGCVCVLLAPSARSDYQIAKSLAQRGTKVVIVNGFAKDQFSVPAEATMAYFVKPLTYNSQVAGYLLREYPGPWTVVDATSKQALQTFGDSEILVANTNTPDLRESGRLVQKSVDERAIQSRQRSR